MLPAQPPNSRRRSGTRNATFRMCSWSGRMWFLKRSRNTMMVSYAIEPQMSVVMAADYRQLRQEHEQPHHRHVDERDHDRRAAHVFRALGEHVVLEGDAVD